MQGGGGEHLGTSKSSAKPRSLTVHGGLGGPPMWPLLNTPPNAPLPPLMAK